MRFSLCPKCSKWPGKMCREMETDLQAKIVQNGSKLAFLKESSARGKTGILKCAWLDYTNELVALENTKHRLINNSQTAILNLKKYCRPKVGYSFSAASPPLKRSFDSDYGWKKIGAGGVKGVSVCTIIQINTTNPIWKRQRKRWPD